MAASTDNFRYFVSYSGVRLPLKLVNELEASETQNRNTYFRAKYDEEGRMLLCQKMVYGEPELEHRYHYHDNGTLRQAHIRMGDEQRELNFNEQGEPLD